MGETYGGKDESEIYLTSMLDFWNIEKSPQKIAEKDRNLENLTSKTKLRSKLQSSR